MSVTTSQTATQVDYFRAQLYPPLPDSPLAKTKLLLPLQNIVEIVTIQRQDICPLPGVVAGILGVTNQRGQLVWILDLCGMGGGMPQARYVNPQEKLTVILLQSDQGQVGCLVAQLQGIVPLDGSMLQRIEDQWQGFYLFCDRQRIQGEDILFVLNVARLFEYLQTVS